MDEFVGAPVLIFGENRGRFRLERVPSCPDAFAAVLDPNWPAAAEQPNLSWLPSLLSILSSRSPEPQSQSSHFHADNQGAALLTQFCLIFPEVSGLLSPESCSLISRRTSSPSPARGLQSSTNLLRLIPKL